MDGMGAAGVRWPEKHGRLGPWKKTRPLCAPPELRKSDQSTLTTSAERRHKVARTGRKSANAGAKNVDHAVCGRSQGHALEWELDGWGSSNDRVQ